MAAADPGGGQRLGTSAHHPGRAHAHRQRLLEPARTQLAHGALRGGDRSRRATARIEGPAVRWAHGLRARHGRRDRRRRQRADTQSRRHRHAAAAAGAARERHGAAGPGLRPGTHGDDSRYAGHRRRRHHTQRAQRPVPLAPVVRRSLRQRGPEVSRPARGGSAVERDHRGSGRHGPGGRRLGVRAPGCPAGPCYDGLMQEILVPVSPGELLDKITILRIKSARMSDAAKLANVRHELGLLESTWRAAVPAGVDLAAEEQALAAVDAKLSDVDELLRQQEGERRLDAEFIELARAGYINNDERAAIKKRINLALGSVLVEEKSYRRYR